MLQAEAELMAEALDDVFGWELLQLGLWGPRGSFLSGCRTRRHAVVANERSRITDADVGVLTGYRWPGNVREMAAVMDRAVLVGQGTSLDVAAALGQATPPVEVVATTSPAGARPTAIEPLDLVVRRHIETALAETHGRVDGPYGAARLLQINPHTLRARMRKLGVDWRRFRLHLTR